MMVMTVPLIVATVISVVNISPLILLTMKNAPVMNPLFVAKILIVLTLTRVLPILANMVFVP